MSLALTTPITGLLQTGQTAPTYTIAADQPPPNVAGRQFVVTALGGTQTGVDASSSSRPFTILLYRPSQLALPPTVVNGVLSGPIKRNNFVIISRKGVTAVTGAPSQVAIIRTQIEIPAGADVVDAPNVRALIAMHFGAGTQLAANLGDSVISGSV
jgi:stage V sporulation protein SpoVS